ncbi:MAG: hypothetical protein P8Y14_21045 [Anaerolineales bacterium]
METLRGSKKRWVSREFHLARPATPPEQVDHSEFAQLLAFVPVFLGILGKLVLAELSAA